MRIGPFVTFLLGTLAGAVIVVALHHYPDHITTTETYCHLCGVRLHETQTETYLGQRLTKRTLATGLFNLLASQNEKGHRHQWVEPRAYVTPTRPAPEFTDKQDFHQAFMQKKLSDLQRLEGSAKLLGLIEASMTYDFDRTRRSLLWRILDPKKYVDINVIYLFDRPGTWAQRWAVMDRFFDLYKCKFTSASIECTVPTQKEDGTYVRTEVFSRKSRDAKLGGGIKSVFTSVDWRKWTPPPTRPPIDTSTKVAPVPAPATEPSTTVTPPSQPPPTDAEPAPADEADTPAPTAVPK